MIIVLISIHVNRELANKEKTFVQIQKPTFKKLSTRRIKKHNTILTALLLLDTTSHNSVAESVDMENATTGTNVETISISGTRTSREINEIAASVTRITNDQIDAMAATHIRDLLRYEPGVSVEGSGR